jgi:N utilization substance protein A
LAIGKEGQNVRLAARLTGWKIDIKDIAKYDYEAEHRKIEAMQAIALAAQEAQEDEDEGVETLDLSDSDLEVETTDQEEE